MNQKKFIFKNDSLIVLIGHMGVGKSSLVASHFAPHHVVSSDFIRSQLTGDFENQECSKTAFEILYATVDARAKAGYLTIVDTTGNASVLNHVLEISRKYDRPLYAVKFAHLTPDQITPERMEHRMRYLDVLDRQVTRIDSTIIPGGYKVYDVVNPDDVSIEFDRASTQDIVHLDPAFKWLVVPDLHGEYEALEHHIKLYEEDRDDVRFIFLGDIVDRGMSSYKTFQLVKDQIDNHNAIGVISNHDNKFYRWLKKWQADADHLQKYAYFSSTVGMEYKMTLAHGLDLTVLEFLNLSSGDRDKYASDFIEYYDNAPVCAKLENDSILHVFAHAGVDFEMVHGLPLNKRNISHALYSTMVEIEEALAVCGNLPKFVTINLGHDAMLDFKRHVIEGTFRDEIDGRYGRRIVKHDIGLGKASYDLIKKTVGPVDFKLIGID